MVELECGICAEPYDLSARQAKALSCGHTLCLQCLQSLPSHLCPICCTPIPTTLPLIPTNSVIQSAIVGDQVYCPKHLTPVSAFCLGHMTVMCAGCQHLNPTSTCVVKNAYTDTQEIWTAVYWEIERVSSSVSVESPELAQALSNRYNVSLTLALKLLAALYDLAAPPKLSSAVDTVDRLPACQSEAIQQKACCCALL